MVCLGFPILSRLAHSTSALMDIPPHAVRLVILLFFFCKSNSPLKQDCPPGKISLESWGSLPQEAFRLVVTKGDTDQPEWGHMPTNDEIPALRQQIISTDWKIRLQAVRRLAQLAQTPTAGVAANILFEALTDSVEEVRNATREAFTQLGKVGIAKLIERLNCNDFDPNYYDYRQAEDMLVWIGEPVIEALTEVLHNGDPCARHSAAQLLKRIPEQRS